MEGHIQDTVERTHVDIADHALRVPLSQGAIGSSIMLRKFVIALIAVGLLGVFLPADAMARGHGGHGGGFHRGGFHRGGFHRGGFSRGYRGHGFGRHRFGRGYRRHGFGGFFFGNSCYAWTPFGYQWVCGYYY